MPARKRTPAKAVAKTTKKASKAPRPSRPVKKTAASDGFPDRLFAIASPRSSGGVSLFDAANIDASNVGAFQSDGDLIQRAVLRLRDAGFEVLQASSIMINIAGARATFERAFNTTLAAVQLDTVKAFGVVEKATFFDDPSTSLRGFISIAGTAFEDVLEGVGLEEPRYFMAPSPFAPTKSYWHLTMPGDVSLGCNADRAHRSGITGAGIHVAMVDSGWYAHPYFTERGYRSTAVTLGPGTADPTHDELGHGTGESANLFAVAPDITLHPVKAALSGTQNTVLVNATAAFNAAVAMNPHIITNSWGFDFQFGPLSAASQALAAAVAAAVASGIVVVFSAGNGHYGYPGQHPDVISAGGVFMAPDGSLSASNYASGFMSNIYPGRRVPDVSGLVGMLPKAAYIMLPVEPNDTLDSTLAGGTWPNADETLANDGWGAFSGTSAAAPQVAGVAALIKQTCPHLSPAEIKDILMTTARDVTVGTNNPRFGNAATVGPDTATGNGLVDANKAVLLAKLRCIKIPLVPIHPLLPLLPLQPVQPLFPIQPIQPIHPILPLLPLQPVQPLFPIQPIQPILPLQPLQPLHPLLPLIPIQPIGPIDPGPLAGGVPLTAADLEQLERMIIESDNPNFP